MPTYFGCLRRLVKKSRRGWERAALKARQGRGFAVIGIGDGLERTSRARDAPAAGILGSARTGLTFSRARLRVTWDGRPAASIDASAYSLEREFYIIAISANTWSRASQW